jgi:hypothetical protein
VPDLKTHLKGGKISSTEESTLAAVPPFAPQARVEYLRTGKAVIAWSSRSNKRSVFIFTKLNMSPFVW